VAVTTRPAVFIDKDGTLIRDIPYNVDPARVALSEGAGEALGMLQQAGYALVVVSNQSGVARGLFPEPALQGVEERIRMLLAEEGVSLDGFFFCTHGPLDGCGCRKPAPGLLQQAAKELALDLERSWMVGDILNDVQAGHGAGCRAILLDASGETEWRSGAGRDPDFIADGLVEAAEEIIRTHVREVAGCVGTPSWTEKLVFDRERLLSKLRQEQARSERVVLTNGCFDILHAGHVRYLATARAMGDRLVVGLNSDAGVRRLKGEGRPVNRLLDRAEVLAALGCVDYVVPFDDETAGELVRWFEPDIYVKGGDYAVESLPEAPLVQAYGGSVRIVQLVAGRSTSTTIARVRRSRTG
jgi:D-glycero-D-manno-heptose 1,7-bisphosphate phosphatase